MRAGLIAVSGLILAAVVLAATSDRSPAKKSGLPNPRTDMNQQDRQSAVFAAGCFWCVEAVFQELDGVLEVESGYAGDSAQTANYKKVCEGTTNHAEAVRIVFDPTRISYGQLLKVFFATHDPTQLNRQGPDAGRQYRSAIFYAGDEQKRVAEAYIRQLEEEKAFPRKIVTTLEPLKAFYPAEDYHQDFAQRNPNHPYITHWAVPKVAKVRKEFVEPARKSAASAPATKPTEP